MARLRALASCYKRQMKLLKAQESGLERVGCRVQDVLSLLRHQEIFRASVLRAASHCTGLGKTMRTPTKNTPIGTSILTPSCNITPTRETARDGAYDEFASLTQNDCSEAPRDGTAPSTPPAGSVEPAYDGAEPSPSSPFTYDGVRAEPAAGGFDSLRQLHRAYAERDQNARQVRALIQAEREQRALLEEATLRECAAYERGVNDAERALLEPTVRKQVRAERRERFAEAVSAAVRRACLQAVGVGVLVGAAVYYFHDDGTDFQVPARVAHHVELALTHAKLALSS